jgi:predicted transcriptional regulator
MLTNFTMRVDDDLKAAFVAAAKRRNRTASLLVRDYMQVYVEQATHDDWVRREVQAGLADAADPMVETISNDDVAADILSRLNAR